MKKSKFVLPFLAVIMAVGLAFANNNLQANGWIDLDGTPTQLSSDPCMGSGYDCKVIFEDDPQERVFDVYTDSNLNVHKSSGVANPYIEPNLP
ncbi:MAG: hypothetical protein CL868_19825 [Cytophagaceae bacterium]|nr:hypothetical protein [Cytophagaceae bacterium]|tara:strand:+ start:2919 stop:3197 length:279 start_codon:yes stop_codon:yes gene_type:complete